jgi:hypothetical protein
MTSNEIDFASSRELKPEELGAVSGGWVSKEHGAENIPPLPSEFCVPIETRPGQYVVYCPR